MDHRQRDRINPLVLLGIVVALLVAAFFCYTGHPVTGSNLYSPRVPGWIAVVLFVLIGALVRLVDRWRPRKPEKENQDDASRKT
jgi:protein-S-isoprenylcysteine O-methyltransferase Ste14